MKQKRKFTNDILLAGELITRRVFSTDDNVQVGVIKDLMIDPNLLEVAALVTTEGDVLKRDIYMIPSGEVKTWDEKTIVLVSKADVIRRQDELPECEHWLSVVHELLGQDVITTTGTPLGKLKDIAVDQNGKITGYELNLEETARPADYKGRIDYIPSLSTHSLGEEVLIINAKDLAWIVD